MCSVNVLKVVQFIVAQMCFKRFKISGTHETFTMKHIQFMKKYILYCDCFIVPIMVVWFL